MEDWSLDFEKMLEVMAKDVERFFTDLSRDVDRMVDDFVEASEAIAEQMQTTFSTEIEPRLTEFIDPILEAYLGFEVVVEETAQPIIHTVDPVMNNHPACIGCRHYHGQMYGSNMLVCGMHPYGWEEEKCPDWQSVWQE